MQENYFTLAQSSAEKTPLHIAAGNNDIETTKKLLATQNVDINAKDDRHWTPLHYAAFHGHAEIVKLLLENNAKVNAKDINGLTPLHEAARSEHKNSSADGYRHAEIVNLLLEKGAGPASEDNDNYTPLHYLARFFRPVYSIKHGEVVKMVKSLLMKGANLETKTNIGETALHMAARSGCSDIAALLLINGANYKTLNKYKQTPSDVATENDRAEIIDLISRYDLFIKKTRTICMIWKTEKYSIPFNKLPLDLTQEILKKIAEQVLPDSIRDEVTTKISQLKLKI